MPTSLLGSGSEEDCCWCDAALPFPRRRDLPCAPSIHPSSSGTTRRGAGVSTGKIPSSTCCTSSSHSKCCAKRIQMLGLPFCNVAVARQGHDSTHTRADETKKEVGSFDDAVACDMS
ncbi:hypothetical protein SEVIR_5G036250v4 [Setaria viridis]|uniref:Uncharacterized protein n=1 Tax=Setaria viridis TaxID=4556 RepID=A0A4V6D957_SETVI|nr:hypothetical protein SEVIR_5G036250v2 [Setaria viridis]